MSLFYSCIYNNLFVLFKNIFSKCFCTYLRTLFIIYFTKHIKGQRNRPPSCLFRGEQGGAYIDFHSRGAVLGRCMIRTEVISIFPTI